MAGKRKSLCVDEKVSVIRAIEKGEKKSAVSRRFDLSHSTVATIWKNKETILQASLEGNFSKKLKKPKFEELDQATYSWFNKQRESNVLISGPIVKAAAIKFAKQLCITEFKASEGWLGKFKHRHKIMFGKVNEDESDVDTNVTRDLVPKCKEEANSADEKDDEVVNSEQSPTIQQALDAAKLIENFLLFQQDDSTYRDMNRIHKIIRNKYCTSMAKNARQC